MTAREAGVVGPGRVGLSLAAALEAGRAVDDVWVAGRRRERPPFLDGRPEVGYGVRDHWTRELPGRTADELLLFFCVPDRAITDVAREWSGRLAEAGILGGRERSASAGPVLRAAFHTSGSRPASDLAPLRGGEDGAPAASLHPLCAVAEPDPDAFVGVTFGAEGDADAVEVGAAIAEAIGGRILRVPTGEKARYHAGAVFASNLLVACLGLGLRQVAEASGGAASAEDVLPLARSALDQVERRGLRGGATGPVVRGDVGTVEADLEGLDPSARSLYASLTAELLRQADVEPAVRRAVARLLGDADPNPCGARGGRGGSGGDVAAAPDRPPTADD